MIIESINSRLVTAWSWRSGHKMEIDMNEDCREEIMAVLWRNGGCTALSYYSH